MQSPEGEKDFKVYTYEELTDPETFSSVGRRLTELRNKGPLTDLERSEFLGMFPAWFHVLYDPI